MIFVIKWKAFQSFSLSFFLSLSSSYFSVPPKHSFHEWISSSSAIVYCPFVLLFTNIGQRVDEMIFETLQVSINMKCVSNWTVKLLRLCCARIHGTKLNFKREKKIMTLNDKLWRTRIFRHVFDVIRKKFASRKFVRPSDLRIVFVCILFCRRLLISGPRGYIESWKYPLFSWCDNMFMHAIIIIIIIINDFCNLCITWCTSISVRMTYM